MDPRPSRHRHTIFSDAVDRRPDPAVGARCARPDRRGPSGNGADDHRPGCVDASGVSTRAPRHLISDRACWRTGPASLGFGGRRFVRCRGAGHCRYRSAPPPSRLPLPAARTGPRPDPGPDPGPTLHHLAQTVQADDDADLAADHETVPVFPVDDDQRRLDPGWLEVGTRGWRSRDR